MSNKIDNFQREHLKELGNVNFINPLEFKEPRTLNADQNKKIQELMSRDFIIYFEKKEDADNAENILNKIRLKDKEIFKIDNRGLDLFVTFVYPNEIFKEDYLDNYKIDIYNYISFVAIKNGMHSQNGFYYDSFSNYEKKQINITEIKEKILQFFN